MWQETASLRFFGLMNQWFGNLRLAIISLIFFFVIGLILLPFVTVQKAIADVKKYEAEGGHA